MHINGKQYNFKELDLVGCMMLTVLVVLIFVQNSVAKKFSIRYRKCCSQPYFVAFVEMSKILAFFFTGKAR